MSILQTSADTSFPIFDTVGAWVPHGRFVVSGAQSGPLSGLTFAAKDLFDVAGHPTGAGNPAWLATHPVPAANSPIIDTLLAAGATLVGKTLTDELAYSIHGDNFHYGTPINASAPARVPGGSSSGSVAAVAAKLCDFALGTDTGGSTRVPASYCGVWGLRTTHDLLPRSAMVPLNPSFDTPTWLAHDAATFLRVADVLVPPARETWFRRVVLFEDALAQAGEVFHDKVEQVFSALSSKLKPRRQNVAAVSGEGSLDDWRQTYITISGREGWAAHGAWIEEHRPVFGPAIAGRWEMARSVTEAAANAALVRKEGIRAHIRSILEDDGIAVIPSAASVAPLLTASAADIDAIRACCFRITCIAGLGGLPQVSIPFIGKGGLPIGVSLLGPAGTDHALVTLAVSLFHELQQNRSDLD